MGKRGFGLEDWKQEFAEDLYGRSYGEMSTEEMLKCFVLWLSVRYLHDDLDYVIASHHSDSTFFAVFNITA